MQASTLNGPDGSRIAVLLAAARLVELRSLVLAAHGLTPAQQRVATLVLQGWSTPRMVEELQISTYTLQEHLGAIFEKFGVGSRRELVAVVAGHG